MGLKTVALGIILILILSLSIIAAVEWLRVNVDPTSEFFVGVEFAYSDNISDLKALVDKVKNYTNLFVIGSLETSFNQTALDEACDYIVDSGLHFIVLFTDSTKYSYATFDWMEDAKQKYSDKFSGVYRYDEPGGNQLDQADMIVENATDYADAATSYATGLGLIVEYYLNYTPRVLTADYGLYWFDYKAGYTTVLTEFGWNHSRPLQIALCSSAAKAHNKDWGAIVTWEYTNPPYIESKEELYDDMILAYKNGAKYVVVFNYPKIEQYGILTENHFDALRDFWNYIHNNPQEHGVIQSEVAYVLPQDYGFGFRNPIDSIWGLWNTDDLSQKVWDDANTLLDQYGSRLDIVYNDPEVIDAVKRRYDKLFFWNEPIT